MPLCYNIHTNHFVCDRRKKISLEENKRKYRANNSLEKMVAQYHLDTETKPPKKCDYAIYIYDDEDETKNDNRLIFIELKGSDILSATKQISQSINDFVKIPNIECKVIDARIVASKVPTPNIKSTDIVKCKDLLKQYGGCLIIRSNGNFEEDI